MDRCPHCHSPRYYFDNTPGDHFICGESLVTVEDEDRTLACDYIKDLTEELHDQAICHLHPSKYQDKEITIYNGETRTVKDPIEWSHSFTSHEEGGCDWLARTFPERYELIPGGIRLKGNK